MPRSRHGANAQVKQQAETEQQQAERIALEERRYAEHQRARLAATSRAEELLLSLLSDEQARSYRERGWFEVTGSRGGRWRIRNQGQADNVDLAYRRPELQVA